MTMCSSEHCKGFELRDLQPGDAVQVDFLLNRGHSDLSKYRATKVTKSAENSRNIQRWQETGEVLAFHHPKKSGLIAVNVGGTEDHVFFGAEHCKGFELKDLQPGDAVQVDFRLDRYRLGYAKYLATKVTKSAKKPRNIQRWHETGEVSRLFRHKKSGLIAVNVGGTDDHVFFGAEHCKGFEVKDLQPGDAVQVDFLLNRGHSDVGKYRATKVTKSAEKPRNIQRWHETGEVLAFHHPKKSGFIAVNVGGTDDHVFFGA